MKLMEDNRLDVGGWEGGRDYDRNRFLGRERK